MKRRLLQTEHRTDPMVTDRHIEILLAELERLKAVKRLSTADRELICSGNAMKLYGGKL